MDTALIPEVVDAGGTEPVVEDPDSPIEHPLVSGHTISPPQWNAFQAYYLSDGARSVRVTAAIAAAQTSRATVYRWMSSGWWGELFDKHVAVEQKMFHADLLKLRVEAAKGLKKVLNAEELPKGAAGALVQGVALLTKVGEKPLQDSRNITTVNNNTLDNRGGVLISAKTVDEIPDHQTLMKIITGELRLSDEEG